MKRRAFSHHESGFTIVEIAAATLLSLLFSAAFFAAFYVMRNELHQQSRFFTSNRSVRFAMDSISRDVHEARRIVPSRGGLTSGDQTLILELPSINANGEPTNFDTQFDYVVYRINPSDATQLVRSVDVLNGVSVRNAGGDASDQIIGRNLQTIQFSTTAGVGLSSAGNLNGMRNLNVQVRSRGTTLRNSMTQTTEGDSDLRMRNKIF